MGAENANNARRKAEASTTKTTHDDATTDPDERPALERTGGPPADRQPADDARNQGPDRRDGPGSAGDTVTVNYVGALYKGGKVFDASWKRKEPFTFALGKAP